jgi:sugar/nucleoside kinase (ribokinase family)
LTKRIVVVGDIVTDVVARHSGPLHVGSDSTAIVASYGGGSAANVAAWLAADSAAPVSYVGRIGDDAAGRAQVAELQRAGVDVRVGIDTEHCTGCVVVLVDSSGQRTMLPDRGANSFLSPADLPHELFAAGCHMHLSGYPLLHESSRAAALTALDLARGADMTVSIDPASAAPLAALGAQRFRRWTAGARLCIANLDEAAVLAGTDRAAAGDGVAIALELASAAYREVVVKLGADGAIWSDGSSVAAVPSVPARVVDTTGAGDAFAAGFLAAWTAGATPHDALSAGVTLAAVAVATPGARPLLQNSPAANSPR